MKAMGQRFVLVMVCSVLILVPLSLVGSEMQAPPAEQQQEEEEEPAEDTRRGGRGGRDDDSIKPYADVITEDARSDEGVFTVHQVKEQFYYEIPTSELGREFLWVGRIAKTTGGQGYGGQKLDTRVVRWERRGDRVLLRNVSHAVVADKNLPIAQAVDANNNFPDNRATSWAS